MHIITLNSQFSILNSQLSTLNSQLSTLNSQFSTPNLLVSPIFSNFAIRLPQFAAHAPEIR